MGGAVYSVKLANCSYNSVHLKNNHAKSSGGALYFTEIKNISIQNSQI